MSRYKKRKKKYIIIIKYKNRKYNNIIYIYTALENKNIIFYTKYK